LEMNYAVGPKSGEEDSWKDSISLEEGKVDVTSEARLRGGEVRGVLAYGGSEESRKEKQVIEDMDTLDGLGRSL